MSKSNNIAWAITIAALSAWYWIWRNGRNSSLPSLVNNNDMDFRGRTDLARGYRNNNPLNIRYSAGNPWEGKISYFRNTDEKKEFEQFDSMEYGYRAAFVLMRNKISQGYDTVEKLIGVWAPPTENNTNGYIARVCATALLDPSDRINRNDRDTLTKMAYAMSIVENDSNKYKAANHAAGLPNMDIINAGWELI